MPAVLRLWIFTIDASVSSSSKFQAFLFVFISSSRPDYKLRLHRPPTPRSNGPHRPACLHPWHQSHHHLTTIAHRMIADLMPMILNPESKAQPNRAAVAKRVSNASALTQGVKSVFRFVRFAEIEILFCCLHNRFYHFQRSCKFPIPFFSYFFWFFA